MESIIHKRFHHSNDDSYFVVGGDSDMILQGTKKERKKGKRERKTEYEKWNIKNEKQSKGYDSAR